MLNVESASALGGRIKLVALLYTGQGQRWRRGFAVDGGVRSVAASDPEPEFCSQQDSAHFIPDTDPHVLGRAASREDVGGGLGQYGHGVIRGRIKVGHLPALIVDQQVIIKQVKEVALHPASSVAPTVGSLPPSTTFTAVTSRRVQESGPGRENSGQTVPPPQAVATREFRPALLPR